MSDQSALGAILRLQAKLRAAGIEITRIEVATLDDVAKLTGLIPGAVFCDPAYDGQNKIAGIEITAREVE